MSLISKKDTISFVTALIFKKQWELRTYYTTLTCMHAAVRQQEFFSIL